VQPDPKRRLDTANHANAEDIVVPPDPHLLESLRAVGYSFETAVADIIDNSLTAGATEVQILSSATGEPRFAVLDNGTGMTRADAIRAMTLAAESPQGSRKEHDLGRFGLGMKTASLSQCRTLTLSTKRGASISTFQWNLDYIAKTGQWNLKEITHPSHTEFLGLEALMQLHSGTLVHWSELDRLKLSEGPDQAAFDAATIRVRDHCELVFHRFISGSDARQVDILLNGRKLHSYDPFLSENKATRKQNQTFTLAGVKVPVTAYTLPHLSRMTTSQRTAITKYGNLRDTQGFYLYRAGRLVIWATWFRLNSKKELASLARVRVDVPNTLDHLWALDIKKSHAQAPRELRDRLRTLSQEFVSPSRQTALFRGIRQKPNNQFINTWNLIKGRDDFRYEVNRQHPALANLVEHLDENQKIALEGLLESIETTLPLQDAHNRMSEDRIPAPIPDTQELVQQALKYRPLFEPNQFIPSVLSMEPFSRDPQLPLALEKHMSEKSKGAF